MTGLTDVSRETISRLAEFESALLKWNARINLVSKSTLADIRTRHIEDSAQLWSAAEKPRTWVDLGSGGGLPGLILAILAKGDGNDTKFTFVESDQRKCAFLRSVIRDQRLDATVVSKRIEETAALAGDVVSARALAPLDVLLEYAERHMHPDGMAIFPKGKNWQNEVELASKSWEMTCTPIPSVTDPAAAVLKIKGLQRV